MSNNADHRGRAKTLSVPDEGQKVYVKVKKKTYVKAKKKTYEIVGPHQQPRSWIIKGPDEELLRRNRRHFLIIPDQRTRSPEDLDWFGWIWFEDWRQKSLMKKNDGRKKTLKMEKAQERRYSRKKILKKEPHKQSPQKIRLKLVEVYDRIKDRFLNIHPTITTSCTSCKLS